MPKYVDGFVIPLKKASEEDYRAIAELSSQLWLEHGALEYFECIGDDLAHEGVTSFPAMSGAADDETVIFAFIVYESRERRDEVNAKVFADPRMASIMAGKGCPFDPKRMAYGGFRAIVEGSK